MKFIDFKRHISILAGEQDASLVDYIQAGRMMTEIEDEPLPYYMRKLKVALLSNFTIQGLPEIMKARGVPHNLFLECYTAPYNQFSQEILNTDSKLYAFNPDIIYLLIDAFDVFDVIDAIHVKNLLDTLIERMSSHIVISDFITGRSITAVPRPWNLNQRIKDFGNNRVTIFALAEFLESVIPRRTWRIQYPKYRELGDFRITPIAFPALAEELLGYAVAAAGNTRKCVVVDLDNTLWEGVVGEDEPDALRPNLEIQNRLLDLHNNGVLIAANSMNAAEEALSVFELHQMPIGKKHFVAMRINWNPKDRNLAEIAEELNLGLDSFVFVDDDPYQRGLVQNSFPEVAVLDPRAFLSFAGFRRWNITEEDKRRNEMYAKERVRKDFEIKFQNPDDFLRELKLEIKVREASGDLIPRVSQLTQKTNQFNVATRRYSEEEIKERLMNGWKVWAAEVTDKFGDYGLTGVCMVEPTDENWRIDNFLLSCRVLGRGVEQTFLGKVIGEARKEGATCIIGEFSPTVKNKPCETFFKDAGFSHVKSEGGSQFYEFRLNERAYKMPDYVKVV